MYILFVNFNLKNMSQQEFEGLCDRLAPVISEVPGLLSKVWLANPETNTYGGICTFQDKKSLEAYAQSEISHSVATHPNFTNIIAREFGILEGPTEVTRGLDRVAVV